MDLQSFWHVKMRVVQRNIHIRSNVLISKSLIRWLCDVYDFKNGWLIVLLIYRSDYWKKFYVVGRNASGFDTYLSNHIDKIFDLEFEL